MKLESTPLVLQFDPFNTNTTGTPNHDIGALVRAADGRAFRFSRVGAANISRGKLELAPAPKTNHHNATAIASPALTQDPTFTLGATAAAAGEYDEGYVAVNVTPDVGRVYKIARMGAIGSAGIALPHLYEPIQTAWTTATRVSLIHNASSNLVEAAVATRRGAGVTLVDAVIGAFVWAQTKGVVAALAGSAVTLGSRLISDGSTAGALTDNTDVTAPQAEIEVAQASIMAGVTGEYRPVVLDID